MRSSSGNQGCDFGRVWVNTDRRISVEDRGRSWTFAGWPADLTVLAQVVMIDVALAGDNAVVVGMAVAGLPMHRRRSAILLGIGGATVLRILLGAVALRLLDIIGLTLAGGLLLLWVCWRMFRELRAISARRTASAVRRKRCARR